MLPCPGSIPNLHFLSLFFLCFSHVFSNHSLTSQNTLQLTCPNRTLAENQPSAALSPPSSALPPSSAFLHPYPHNPFAVASASPTAFRCLSVRRLRPRSAVLEGSTSIQEEGEAEMKGSENQMDFPPYCRSHLRSNTYNTLVHIFSHLSALSTSHHSPTHHLQIPDNGSGRMEQEKQQKEPECSEFVGSDFKDLKDPVPQKEIQEVHETIEGVEDKGKDFNANRKVLNDIELMMGIEKDEDSLRRQAEAMSMQVNDFNMEQRLIDELELVVNGTEELVCDNGLIPSNLGLDEKQSVSSEVDVMDYKVEHVEFKNADVNNSGDVGKLQVQGEHNQLVSESFHPSLMVNVSTSTKGQTSASAVITSSIKHDTPIDPIEKVDIEEGEISGDFGMDGNSFDMSSIDSLILQQKNMDEVKKPKTVVENLIFPCKMRNGEKEGYKSNSFIVNALQEGHNSGQVEPSTSDKIGIACGVEIAGECGSVLKPGNSKDTHIGSKWVADLPTKFSQNQVLHRGLLVEASKDHGRSSEVKQKVDVSNKKKRGPGSKEKKAKKKLKQRKKRAEMNRQLGGKRLKLPPPPVQKPKTITYCRHYRYGRCHEGDKCHFSHDAEPLTKSKPCCHFARHSCMKGDDCPFDHQLSKYSCTNFVSGGSCSRGDACMFSHQVPTEKDIPTLSNVSRPELKSPFLSGSTNFSMPLNDHGCSAVQQNHLSNSAGIHSHINAEHKVTSTVQKHPMAPPKGISFMNVAKSSLLSPSTPKQGMITTNKGSHVQVGTCADQSASGTNQTMVDVPTKLPAVTPKGINFLSFGKDSVCSFKSSISSLSYRENGIKLPQLANFGFPVQASSSLNKDDYSRVSDGTKRSLPRTDLFSNEVLDNTQSVAEGMKLNFPGRPSIDDARTDLQRSFNSHGDHSHSKSAQKEKKSSDNSQPSTVTSSMLLVPPFVSPNQSSELLASGYRKYASNSGQRAILSTLAFAAEHQSDIKMKDPSGASSV